MSLKVSHCGLMTIWWHKNGSRLAQVMACCLTTPSHYLSSWNTVQWKCYVFLLDLVSPKLSTTDYQVLRLTEGHRDGRIWWFQDTSMSNKVGAGHNECFPIFLLMISDEFSVNIIQNVQNPIAGIHCRQNEKELLHLPRQCIGFPNSIQQNHSSLAILVKRRQSPPSVVLCH